MGDYVTLGVLARLLLRTIQQGLRRSSMPMATPARVELLPTCHLNLRKADPDLPLACDLTEPTTTQRDLLKILWTGDLVGADEVAVRIHPRALTSEKPTYRRR